MSLNRGVASVFPRRAGVKTALLGGALLAFAVIGVKPAPSQRIGIPAVIGIPEDWSHHHVVFSQPRTAEDAVRLQQEPRYWHQWYRRNVKWAVPQTAPAQTAMDLAPGGEAALSRWPPISLEESNRRRRPPQGESGLWYQSLGVSGATLGPGNFPAKYTFNPIAAASCANDFVAINTSLATGTGPGTVTVTFSAAADTSGTLVITSGGAVLTMTAGTANSGATWNNNSAVANTNATNFNTQLNLAANGPSVGVYSTRAGGTVTIHSTHLGAFSISVKNNTLSNVSNPSNGNTNTNTTSGAANAARVVAYNNLYTGGAPSCTGQTVFFSYETGGNVQNSIALSLDGSQLAFVQSVTTALTGGATATTAELVLLRRSSSTTLTVPTLETPSTYNGCTAPCMVVFPLRNDTTNSSPFVDYLHNNIYVGDDGGILYQFTSVFSGTPAAGGSGWPATVSSGNVLTSPVYDSSTSLVFVASSSANLFSVNSTGTIVTSGLLGLASTNGVQDGPLLDQAASRVYAFVNDDSGSPSASTCPGAADNCRAVYQFTTTSSINGIVPTTALGTKATLGYRSDSNKHVVYVGAFDNIYYSSAASSNPSGNMYVCAAQNISGDSSSPTLIKVAISANKFSTPTTNAALPLTSVATGSDCSPTTEVVSGGSDWVFQGVTFSGNKTGCTGSTTVGCVYNFNVTSGTMPANATAGRKTSGGSSGIAIDTTSGAAGGLQVYFTFLLDAITAAPCAASGTTPTAVGCLIQATQAGLN